MLNGLLSEYLKMKQIFTVLLLVCLHGTVTAQNTTNFAHIGRVDRFDSTLDELIPKGAKIEVLCGGFDWSNCDLGDARPGVKAAAFWQSHH